MGSFVDRSRALRHHCVQTDTGARSAFLVFCSIDSLFGDKLDGA
jgi:hypothetical protein